MSGREDQAVLCAASAYQQKYYLNPRFEVLPESIRRELQTICVLFVEEVGGIFLMEFDEDGELLLRTEAEDGDYSYDEIGAGLMIREIRKHRADLLEGLQLFYQAAVMGER